MKHPLYCSMGSADECQIMRLLMRLIEAKKVIEIGKEETSLT